MLIYLVGQNGRGESSEDEGTPTRAVTPADPMGSRVKVNARGHMMQGSPEGSPLAVDLPRDPYPWVDNVQDQPECTFTR